ncbi:MAG TPA: outer membrane protein transport protein [Longimicrobium sp.]|uniref:OmpP1/FadL family transporter n=1 Tax=Longimicrobium sp. TaxID=2029185 RepID=UPI002EDAB869
MRRSLAIASAAVAACVAVGNPLQAQGSSVDQQSACLAGRVSAGVALPCDDGSTVFFSPAAMAMTPSAFNLGVAVVRSSNTFRYDPGMVPATGETSVDREPEIKLVPQASLNYRLNDRTAVGIAALAPYGLGLKWDACPAETPRCGTTNFEGRFTGYDNDLKGLYIQPTVAFQVVPDRFSVGVGVDYVMGSIEVNRRQFGPAALGLGNTEVADVNLKGDGTAWTYHVGGMLRLEERTWLAARYLGSAKVDIDGDADFTQIDTGNPLVNGALAAQFPADQGVSSEIEFPAMLVVGIGSRATSRLGLALDYQRTFWSSFDAFPVNFETATSDTLRLNYNDANTLRFGAEYQATDALMVRAGFRWNEAATPRATPFLPEGERNYYSLGLGYRMNNALSFDLSGQYINQPDRRGALIPGGPTAGIYEAEGMVFNFTLAYRFGGMRQP